MEISQIINEKKEKKIFLTRKYNLNRKNKIIWYINFEISHEESEIKELLEWLERLWINFLIKWEWENKSNINFIQEEPDYIAFDFVLFDKLENYKDYKKNWVVPIWCSKHNKNLEEFDPKNIIWNWFVYNNFNKWDIFYALVRYLENYKFPYDNKLLINNLIKY